MIEEISPLFPFASGFVFYNQIQAALELLGIVLKFLVNISCGESCCYFQTNLDKVFCHPATLSQDLKN